VKARKPTELQKAIRELQTQLLDPKVREGVLNALIIEDLIKAKKDGHLNPDNTFKGGFKGCVSYQKGKGLSGESAGKLCAYIGRRAGKIK